MGHLLQTVKFRVLASTRSAVVRLRAVARLRMLALVVPPLPLLNPKSPDVELIFETETKGAPLENVPTLVAGEVQLRQQMKIPRKKMRGVLWVEMLAYLGEEVVLLGQPTRIQPVL